jgi:hypothetical protein
VHRDDVPHIAAERVDALEPFALDLGKCPLANLAIILAGILKLADGTRQNDRPEGPEECRAPECWRRPWPDRS